MGEMTAGDQLAIGLLLTTMALLYLTPSIIAAFRGLVGIALYNLFLGWVPIVWLMCLWRACTYRPPAPPVVEVQPVFYPYAAYPPPPPPPAPEPVPVGPPPVTYQPMPAVWDSLAQLRHTDS